MSRPKQITSVTTILFLSLSLAGTSALLAVALLTSVAEAKPASVLLQEGLYAEEIEGNLDAAIKIYEQVIAEAKAAEQTAAQAMYRIGMCYLKKGEKDKAAERFAEVSSRFPEQEDLVAKAEEQLEKITPPTQEADLPPEVMMYIVGLHMESYARAQALNIPANTRVYGVDDKFDLYTGGFAVIKNETGRTWTGEVPVASFSYSNMDVYNEQGEKQKIRMVRQRTGRGGRYQLLWTLDRPVEPGEMRTIGWRVKGTTKLPQEGPRGSSYHSLNMNNHYGPEVLENFFLVLPFNVAIKEQSREYISHKRIGIFDIYQWQSRVPADTMNIVDVVLTPGPVAPTQQFGPVIERVVHSLDENPEDSFIDFDTGRLFTPPKQLQGSQADKELKRWIAAKGIDAGSQVHTTDGQVVDSYLKGRDMVVFSHSWEQWDAMSPLSLQEQVAGVEAKFGRGLRGGQLGGNAWNSKTTFGFKTSEGGVGLLQIIGVTDSKDGLKIRYKMLQEKAVAESSLAFGPVIERVIYQGGSPHDCLIDFETGKLYKVPEPLRGPNVRDEQVLEWVRLKGVDAAGDTTGPTSGPEGSQGLQGFPDDMVATPAPGGWDAPADVLLAMTRPPAPTARARMFVKGELPEAYYFKTREGNMGVLQILGFTEGEPRGVRFRYKMLQEVVEPYDNLANDVKQIDRIIGQWFEYCRKDDPINATELWQSEKGPGDIYKETRQVLTMQPDWRSDGTLEALFLNNNKVVVMCMGNAAIDKAFGERSAIIFELIKTGEGQWKITDMGLRPLRKWHSNDRQLHLNNYPHAQVWQRKVEPAATVKRSIWLPDLETPNANVVLDLASGEQLSAKWLEKDRQYFNKLGKGDLAFDNAKGGGLICLRGGYLQTAEGSESIRADAERSYMRAYKLNIVPCKYQLVTVDGQRYNIDVVSMDTSDAGGVHIEYCRSSETVDTGAEPPDSNGKKLFAIFVTCGTTCDSIEEALEKGDIETAKVLSEQVTKLLPEGRILARGTPVESAAEMLVNQFELFRKALKNNDIDRARTLMAAMQRLGGHSYEMFERLSEPSQAPGGGDQGDPAKAVEFIPALYGVFQGINKAAESNDFETALMLTRKLLEQRGSFEAAVRGTAAQAGVEGGFEMVEMLADALEKKDAARTRSLLEGLNSMGPALQDAIEKEAKRQQKPVAGFGPVIERMIGEDSTVLDFDTDKVFGIPHMLRNKPEEVGLRWAVDNGIDVGADQELIGLDMAGERLASEAWSQISAAELMAIVQNANTVKGWVIMPHSGQYPPTYAFRTREGGIGTVQILDVTDKGAKVQYKMVSKDTPAAEAVDPNSVKKWKMGGLAELAKAARQEIATEAGRRVADNLAEMGWDLRKFEKAETGADLRKSERLDKAEEMFKKALQIDPANASALRGLAVTYMERKDCGEAIRYYETWLKIEPDNSDAKAGLEKAKTSQKLGSRKMFLPDVDTPDAKVVLDLASGELVPAEGGEDALRFFRELGKGDLVYDDALICIRGAKAMWLQGGRAMELEAMHQIEDSTSYKLPALPSRLLVTTAEGNSYDVRILSADGSGMSVECKLLEPVDVERWLYPFQSGTRLRKLGLAVKMYADDHKGKLPDTLRELRPHLKEDFQWIIDNVEYLGKGKSAADHPETVTAYDKTLLEKGNGTTVLFMDTHVDIRQPQDLKKLGIGAVSCPAGFDPVMERAALAALETARKFLAAVISGDEDEAIKYARASTSMAQEIQEFPELADTSKLQVVEVHTADRIAYVITSAIHDDHGRKGQLLLEMVKQRGIWVVSDVDFETPEGLQQDLKRFFEKYPNARTTVIQPGRPVVGILDPWPTGTVFLPSVDTPDANVVLDLGTGEILPAGRGSQQLTIFRDLGKGDLAWDRVLICLRGGSAKLLKGGQQVGLNIEVQREDLTAYRLDSAPCRLLVTTTEGNSYEVIVFEFGDNGIVLDYEGAKGQLGSLSCFGPVRQALISRDQSSSSYTIDFETDKALRIPEMLRAGSAEDALWRWLADSGLDAFADDLLTGVDMAVQKLRLAAWEQISTEELKSIAADAVTIEKGGIIHHHGIYPPTYAFRTRENGAGILQILDVTNKDITLLYKMAGPAEKPGQVDTDKLASWKIGPLPKSPNRKLVDAETLKAFESEELHLEREGLFAVEELYEAASQSEKHNMINRWIGQIRYGRDEKKQEKAAAALGNVAPRDKEIVQALIDFVSQGQGRHRLRAHAFAARALGRIGDLSAVAALIERLDWKPDWMRNYVKVALAEITGVYFGEDKDKWLKWWQETGIKRLKESDSQE